MQAEGLRLKHFQFARFIKFDEIAIVFEIFDTPSLIDAATCNLSSNWVFVA
jgi:hypothetical protein